MTWLGCACRGLLGLRNAILTATKGTAVLNTNFAEYGPWCGELQTRENGSLLAWEQGQATSYAIDSIQARGRLFISPGEDIYENQVRPHALICCYQDDVCHDCLASRQLEAGQGACCLLPSCRCSWMATGSTRGMMGDCFKSSSAEEGWPSC